MATLNVGGSAPSAAQKLDIADGLGLIGVPTISGTWANRATYLAAGHECVFFTDIGIGGSVWYYNTRWRPLAGRYLAYNLTSSVTTTTTPRAAMGSAPFLPGQVQDGDILTMIWSKQMTGASGAEADTSETSASDGAYSIDLNLTTAALTNTNPLLRASYEWRRINNSTLRALSIGGSTGFGAAGATIADVTATPNMDTTPWFLQLSGKLTSGAVSATSSLRGFQVWHTAGA